MDRYDAYLFDWDGTLSNSHDTWLGIMHGQLRQHGITLSDEQVVKQLFGRYPDGMSELGFAPDEIKVLAKDLEVAGKQQLPLASLFPGALAVLERLKEQGKKVALVTACYKDVIDVVIGRHELVELFDVIVTANDVPALKPDPSALLMALQNMQVPPNRAIMIGDSPKDLLAGNNAGTDTLLFYPPEHESQHPLDELKKCQPTYIIHAWQELLDQLQ